MMHRIPTLSISAGCIGLVFALGAGAIGQGRKNFDVLSQIGGFFRKAAVSNDHVFLVEGKSLVVVDMTNPAQPTELSRRPLEFNATPGHILAYGGYLYVTTADQGMQVYNVSNPRSPVYVARLAAYDTYHPSAIVIDGNRLYFGGERFQIFDLTNPTSPTKRANLAYGSSMMAVSQGRAFLAGPPAGVYDVRDAAHPVLLGGELLIGSSSLVCVAMRWPKVATGNVSYFSYPAPFFWPPFYSVYWINLHTYTGGTSWTHVQYENPSYPLYDMVMGPTALFASYGIGGIEAFDTNTLSPIGGVLNPEGGHLLLEGSRLYHYYVDNVSAYDVSVAASPTLLGSWDSLRGSVVAVGLDRAYVLGDGKPVFAIDLRNPLAPRPTGRSSTKVGSPVSATVVGRWLYVADASTGLQVFSLTNPDQPRWVITAGPGQERENKFSMAIAGNRAYVTGADKLLRVFDLSNPTSPTTMGTVSFSNSWAIAASGDYAYLLAGGLQNPSNLVVVNVRDPRKPQVIGSSFLQRAGRCLAVNGNTLFVGNWPVNGPGYVFDLSDPTSPTQISGFPTVSRVVVSNGWAFVVEEGYDTSLRAYSVADPRDIWDGGFLATDFTDIAASGTIVLGVSSGLWVTRFAPPAPQPVDLVPVGFSPTTQRLVPGKPIGFRGWVRNLGPSATSQSFTVAFEATQPEWPATVVTLCDPLLVPAGLASGSSVSLAGIGRTLLGREYLTPGRYTVRVVVDKLNDIIELHENNTMTAPGEFTIVSENDLRPTAFGYWPAVVGAGSSITLTGQFEYTGTGPSTNPFWVEFWCSPNADFSPPRYFLCDSVLVESWWDPGTTYTFSITRKVCGPTQGLRPDSYVVALWVDRPDDIYEKDITNNTLWRSTVRLKVVNPLTGARRWERYR